MFIYADYNLEDDILINIAVGTKHMHLNVILSFVLQLIFSFEELNSVRS